MENICSVCFMHAELFQIPGYTLPMCLKCTEQFSAKGLSLNFYQNLPNNQNQNQNHEPNRSTTNASSHTNTITQTNSTPQQNSVHQPTNSASPENNVSALQTMNIKAEAMELADQLEKSLQNGDNELLYGEEGTCGLCAKTFSRKSSLLSHMRNHSIDRKFICSYCQKGFTQAANLRNHERIHKNERPFICNECGKAFTQVTNLNNHRRLHTGERPFVCIESNCGRSFAQVTNLNNHMKTHHKIQQYVCNQCPKKFTQVTSLNQHLLVHSGVRGYFCPQCPDKTFKQQSHLQQHMKTHGVFPYKCNTCEEKFLQHSHLTHHMRTHEEFKFRCNLCLSAFNQEALLKKHMQRHADEKHLLCPIPLCNDMFIDKQQLTKHLENDHTKTDQLHQIPIKRVLVAAGKYNCYFDGCNDYFDDADKLNEHLMTIHNMQHKDVEARSKMNLMFLEQIKNQMTEQYVSSLEAMNGHYNSIKIKSDINDVSADGPSLDGSNKQSDIKIKCHKCNFFFTNETDLRTHIFYKHPDKKQKVDSQESNGKYKDHHHNDSDISCVCSKCFHIFKSPQSLSRHICRFHDVPQNSQ